MLCDSSHCRCCMLVLVKNVYVNTMELVQIVRHGPVRAAQHARVHVGQFFLSKKNNSSALIPKIVLAEPHLLPIRSSQTGATLLHAAGSNNALRFGRFLMQHVNDFIFEHSEEVPKLENDTGSPKPGSIRDRMSGAGGSASSAGPSKSSSKAPSSPGGRSPSGRICRGPKHVMLMHGTNGTTRRGRRQRVVCVWGGGSCQQGAAMRFLNVQGLGCFAHVLRRGGSNVETSWDGISTTSWGERVCARNEFRSSRRTVPTGQFFSEKNAPVGIVLWAGILIK